MDERQQYRVTALPEAPAMDSLAIYSGTLAVLQQRANLFFVLVRNIEQANHNVVFWLNGGPGCSSMTALFLEHGPFRMLSNGRITRNAHSWHKHADVVYIDQPAGVGYSHAQQKVTTTEDAALHFVAFLDVFMSTFTEYRSSNLYLSGESFAGTYIAHFATHMNLLKRYHIHGILLGSPWISPKHQYGSYIDYAVAHGILSGKYLQKANTEMVECAAKLSASPKKALHSACEKVVTNILDQSKQNGSFCINTFDIRLNDSGDHQGCGMSWPPGVDKLAEYLSVPTI